MNSSRWGVGECTHSSAITATLLPHYNAVRVCLSGAHPSQARPASSVIEVIKKVDMIRKLINLDYAKESGQKKFINKFFKKTFHWWWHSGRMNVCLHGDGVIRAGAKWRRAELLCHSGMRWMWKCRIWVLRQTLNACVRAFMPRREHIPRRWQHVNIFYE